MAEKLAALRKKGGSGGGGSSGPYIPIGKAIYTDGYTNSIKRGASLLDISNGAGPFVNGYPTIIANVSNKNTMTLSQTTATKVQGSNDLETFTDLTPAASMNISSYDYIVWTSSTVNTTITFT